MKKAKIVNIEAIIPGEGHVHLWLQHITKAVAREEFVDGKKTVSQIAFTYEFPGEEPLEVVINIPEVSFTRTVEG